MSRVFTHNFRRIAPLCLTVISLYYLYVHVPTGEIIHDKTILYLPTSTCDITPSLQEVFVMVKTGACEDYERLITQSKTSLQCVPSSSIAYYSDLEEQVGSIHLRDTFNGSVDQWYIDTDDEFILYKKMLEQGSCKGITKEDMQAADPRKGLNGNNDNRGWNLDKWKFLPMADITYSLQSNKKWYIEIEVDTYPIWRNVFNFLANLDHEHDYYIGSPMFVAGVAFIYGGSGAIISQSAMRKVVDHIRENTTDLQKFTHDNWAGDHVMGKTLKDVGVGHTTMSREFVRDSTIGADYSFHWCTAALSFHHVTAEEAVAFHEFETQWFGKFSTQIMRHKDIFHGYILPQLEGLSTEIDWDNNARDDASNHPHFNSTFESCKEICLAASDCVQYRFAYGKCYTTKFPQIGRREPYSRSGWLPDRARKWADDHKPCTRNDEEWSPHNQ
ncbi:hypothetical protein EJ05DRAFT_475085 [Pseudovirgaria hyperparasitica]|uniref:Glycosyltransferase family 31 protein n=1 Tax=Pseudovirgaria hyperparasitica TaxID=470096 RepID=A0A6A6W8F4_9PEZI|nr:uncharacterized protein EJ05DRAFT_475085 [Pseudovirgaria hyperparasitica]KAF2758825.1 hypothetical protein EJ05DRAFT_475085 [Pseudovirgaria hyperparasitica]